MKMSRCDFESRLFKFSEKASVRITAAAESRRPEALATMQFYECYAANSVSMN